MARSAPKQNAGKRNSTVVVLLIVILIAVLLCAAGGYYLITRNNAKVNRAQGGKREAAALQAIRSRQQYADEMLGGLSDLRKRQLLAIMDELLAEWGVSANPREYEYYGKEEDSDGCK